MASSPKLRPSMSVRQLQLISECLDFRITALIQGNQIGNPVLLELVELKKYCDDLQPKSTSAELMLAQYLKQNQQAGVPPAQATGTMSMVTDINLQATQGSLIDSNVTSPIHNKELTDEQKYDLLALRTDKERTEEENVWFLNVGTFVMMRRKGVSNTPVAEGDL